MIQEVIVTTGRADGSTHIAPMGIRHEGEFIIIAPFRPSATLDNLLAGRCAVINFTDDVRVFAGAVTGRREWPLTGSVQVPTARLARSLAHTEVELVRIEDDPVRPRLFCRSVYSMTHLPFPGFNRAQAAVLELAILVSRLDRLPGDKIAQEIAYLRISIDKTAGPREQEAWGWLMARVESARTAAADREIRP